MKRITKVHNAMQHMLLNLLLLLLAHSNRGTQQKKAFKGGNFHEFWECPIQLSLSRLDFWLHVTCLKMSLLQFKLLWQSGPDPPFKKKVKPNEEEAKGKKEKKKEKKSECCTTKSTSQRAQGSFQNAWLSQFGWFIFDKENQICVVCVCVSVCVWFCEKNRFSKSIPLRIFLRG